MKTTKDGAKTMAMGLIAKTSSVGASMNDISPKEPRRAEKKPMLALSSVKRKPGLNLIGGGDDNKDLCCRTSISG